MYAFVSMYNNLKFMMPLTENSGQLFLKRRKFKRKIERLEETFFLKGKSDNFIEYTLNLNWILKTFFKNCAKVLRKVYLSNASLEFIRK